MTRTSTPLVDPDGYFARADALSLRRAAGLVLGFWIATTALGIGRRTVGDVDAPVTSLYPLQTLEATLLYWVLPTIFLSGVAVAVGGRTGEMRLETADALALAAWGLVPLLTADVVANLLYAGFAALEIEPAGTAAEPAIWLFVPLTLLACGWAAYVWRGGLRRGIDLDRSSATATALLAAAGCATLLVLPMVFA